MFWLVCDCSVCNISTWMHFHLMYNNTGFYQLRFLQNQKLYYMLYKHRCYVPIWKIFVTFHIPTPTLQMLLATSHQFFLQWNIPNCISSTDWNHALQIHTACTTVTSNIAVLCSKILLMPHTFSPSTLLVLMESNPTGILCQNALQQ